MEGKRRKGKEEVLRGIRQGKEDKPVKGSKGKKGKVCYGREMKGKKKRGDGKGREMKRMK